MSDIAQLLEEELEEAVTVKDKKALKRYITLLLTNMVDRGSFDNMDKKIDGIKSDIKELTDAMREGFAAVDKRFEAMDKRFEDLIHQMDKRFEAVDKRFEAVDKRFEDMNKRIGFLNWFVPGIITLVVIILKFSL